ncbi:hypothetical protein SAMN05660284_00577 [Formivibrio citricus]|uniref:Uncharacterized protein n=1 Tax=Formivibrio citricus TaxID=83765 RepID=A0A1I4WFV9_9NEIS|nr:hypothetical protein [Formivibrio citricus]SFN12120.1 hypothetical protein SAMN05660284_00577 [Formivibrio citricus]
MLNRLASLFSHHKTPFVNVRVAQAWWKPLNEADAATQLQKVSDAIASMLSTGRMSVTSEVLQSLLWIDNAVQPAFESVCFQYISNPRMPKETEQKLWKEICGFARAMSEAYQAFIQQGGDEKSRAVFGADMPLAIARNLRYLAIKAKWNYFRFEKAPAKLWTEANQIYRLAEIDGVDCNPFPLYPSLSTELSSCADEYLQMLMLATVASNNLSVSQINWVDRWLDSWSKLLQLSRKSQKDVHHYCVCLQDASGPQKVIPAEEGETYRCWGISELVSKVQEILSRLEAGATPKSLGLGEGCNTAGTIELLKHLEVFWTMSMRNCLVQRPERRKVSKAACVIHGLDRLCVHVKEDNERHYREKGSVDVKDRVDYDEVMDMRLYGFVSNRTQQKLSMNPYTVQVKQHNWQTWAIDNESVSGLGAILVYSENEWVRPGVLLGVREDEGKNWHVGVLRRLNRMSDDEIYAGIQILTNTPVTVSMHSDDLDRIESISVAEVGFHGHYDALNVRTGIYLPHKIGDGSVNTLIMHSADYSHGRIYRVRAREKAFTVSLGSVLEKGIDWTWVLVNVLKKDA